MQSLALREDEDAFLPIKAYELGQEFPHRMVLLANVIDALAGRANAEGIVTTAGLNAASRRSGYGRYLRIADLGAWLGISFDFWRRHRPTPLWLHIEKWGGDTETREQKRLRLKPIEDEGNLVLGDNSDLLIPLSLPLGAEQPAVLDALLEQLRRIHAVLALSTSETNSEPP